MTTDQKVLAIIAVGSPATGLLLWLLGAPTELAVSVVAGIFGLQPAIAVAIKDRRRSRAERLREIARHEDGQSALGIGLLVACYVVMATRVARSVAGFVVGGTFDELEVDFLADPTRSIFILAAAIRVPSLVAVTIMVAPIAKWATHSGRSHSFLPILCGIVGAELVEWMLSGVWLLYLNRGSFNIQSAVVSLAAFCASAGVGHFWALKTHDLWLIRRLSRRLTNSDRKALIELTATLPNRAVAAV